MNYDDIDTGANYNKNDDDLIMMIVLVVVVIIIMVMIICYLLDNQDNQQYQYYTTNTSTNDNIHQIIIFFLGTWINRLLMISLVTLNLQHRNIQCFLYLRPCSIQNVQKYFYFEGDLCI